MVVARVKNTLSRQVTRLSQGGRKGGIQSLRRKGEKQTPGVLPVTYTGRLRPKGVPFVGLRYMKG